MTFQKRCSPAETLAGVAATERDSAAGDCTTTVDEVMGTGAMVLPVFASLPLAPAVKASVPAPDTDQVQTKDRVDLPDSALPAGDAGELTSVAAAPPPVAIEGGASASRMTDAPPVFVADSVSDTCWRPAETCVGVAAIESDNVPEVCTVTGPAGAGAGAMAFPLLPSCPVAEAVKLTVPSPPMFQVQVRLFDIPPGRIVPAGFGGELAAFAEAFPVELTTGWGTESRTTSASPPFCSTTESATCCSPAETCAGVALAATES